MVIFIVMCEPDLAAWPMVTSKVQQSPPWHLDGGPMLRRIGAALGATVGVIFMIQWEYSNHLGYIYIYIYTTLIPMVSNFLGKRIKVNMFFYLRGFIMVINWNITGLGVQLGLFMGIHTYIYIYIYIYSWGYSGVQLEYM